MRIIGERKPMVWYDAVDNMVRKPSLLMHEEIRLDYNTVDLMLSFRYEMRREEGSGVPV